MPPPGAEIGNLQPVNRPQPLDLFPKPGHGAGIQHLQFELAHFLQNRPAAQFHQHRQRRNFPQHHLGPTAFKGQLILAVALFQMVGGQAQTFEPLHEIGAEHLAFAVKHVAAQPSAFAPRQRQAAHMVELFAQFAFVDQVGQPHLGTAVDQAEHHIGLRLVAENRLAHQ